jgi:hypothetical protein
MRAGTAATTRVLARARACGRARWRTMQAGAWRAGTWESARRRRTVVRRRRVRWRRGKIGQPADVVAQLLALVLSRFDVEREEEEGSYKGRHL